MKILHQLSSFWPLTESLFMSVFLTCTSKLFQLLPISKTASIFLDICYISTPLVGTKICPSSSCHKNLEWVAWTTEICHSSEGWDVEDKVPADSIPSEDPLFGYCLVVCPYMVFSWCVQWERERQSFGRPPILLERDLTLWLEALCPKTITLEVRASTYELLGGYNQSIAQDSNKELWKKN